MDEFSKFPFRSNTKMTNDKIQQLTHGLQTAFIDQTITSNLAHKPQFVSNNYKEGRKVISSIED